MVQTRTTELGAVLAFFADHPFSLTLLCIFMAMLLISPVRSLRSRKDDFWETPQDGAESEIKTEKEKKPFDWKKKLPMIWVGIASLSTIVRDFGEYPDVLGWVIGMMAAFTALTFLVEWFVRWVHRE